MKIQVLITLFFVFLMGNAQADVNCTVKSDSYCIVLDWVEGPNFGTYSSARVEFYDNNDVLVTPNSSVKVYPWMLMHGHAHGSRPVVSSFISEGIFEVSQIFFMKGMKGTWQLKLEVENKEYILFSQDV